ncbi:MAG TPA: hypothetical protein VLJ68_07220 [Chitinophagaceae bacterium]|nr:hypothetical protein [Chitinophagaceae bacterium]
MKNKLLPIFFLGMSIFSYAQKDDSISNKTWYKILNKTFATIATGQGEAANLATYGSFEPTAGSFKFNFFGPIIKNDSAKAAFFNISAGGDLIGGNSGILFSNSKFNSGMNISGKLHLPIYRELHSSGNELDSISTKIKILDQDRSAEKRNVIANSDPEYILINYRNNSTKLLNITKDIEHANMILDSLKTILSNTPADTARILKLTDTLILLSAKQRQRYTDSDVLKNKVDSLDELISDNLLPIEILNKKIYMIDDLFDSKREALEMSVKITRSSFAWLSMVGNYVRKKYYTFFDSLPFPRQFTENKYSTFSYGIEFNIVVYTADAWPKTKKNPRRLEKIPRIHIGNFGLIRIRNNDIEDFSTTELSDSRKYTSSDSTHSLSTKYFVYTHAITEYKAWKIYLNYYYFIGKTRTMAWHIFPDIEFRDTHKTPLNFGLGLVFAIKNKKDNLVFNMEAYGKLVDIGKVLPQEEKHFWNRNELGIRFGIPIDFPVFK